MSRQRPTEGEGGRYSYDNSKYGDEEELLQSHPQQEYLQQQQYYPQYQQYPQQPPTPRQYPHQPSSVSPFQQSLPPRQPTPPQKFSNNNSFLDDSESYADEEGTGQSHVHKDGWLFRPPENGHVITKGEIISRIIQYYEVCTILFFLIFCKEESNLINSSFCFLSRCLR